MDFYDHPNTCAPTLHAKDEAGRVILELVKLTKTYSTPEPPLGFEVWAYLENEDCPAGNVTYHATEEPLPWAFEPYSHQGHSAKFWFATMPLALAGPFASAQEEIIAEEDARV